MPVHRKDNPSIAAGIQGPVLSRRQLLGSAATGAVVLGATSVPSWAQAPEKTVDVLLIGGGIMSATLGVLLSQLEPNWTIEMLERLDAVAMESSNGWNNAGTGHSALAELNYSPMDAKGNVHIEKAIEINSAFQITRQFLAHQVDVGVLKNPRSFLNSTPHMSFVWGDENTAFLAKRFEALKASPLFSGMQFSTDHDKIAEWVPLMMDGRDRAQKLAATWSPLGTDADWGEVTRQYVTHLKSHPNFALRTSTEVQAIEKTSDGSWNVSTSNRKDGSSTTVKAKFVFIGAGGGALHLLQMAGIPEGDDYAGFPVGGSFLVCDKPEIANQHFAKAYGQASTGAPPMSVPHLDTRVFEGKRHLLFGPFATFSTKFLKEGSLFDLPATITLENIWPMLKVGYDEFDLVEYLAGQLLLSDADRLEALRAYFPNAKAEDWRLWQAGQRVQIIKRDAKKGGILKLGTEIVAAKDGSIAALLGASPGASTAAPIMLDLLQKVFAEKLATPEWQEKVRTMVPSYGVNLNENPEMLAKEWAATAERLQLTLAPPAIDMSAITKPGVSAPAEDIKRVPDMAL
ncbi:malate dehydrogenase (quinone) [Agrobacterium vitis]|uniref:malate dehydrogenase (quinone) n=1 Tax=Rhizobium/Agrobacterium group TaxID=227290 RepID=UPI0012E984B6|nr:MULTISPECIES: malate dehydrogenase (quinone) [Rhizobium/Agrobacterium group]MCF1493986.1 malate dehydrogenase (quinone) [Allorhizobium ampelinum]MVA44327.1 malate dehydrogenase (quinone) [Agrobacterium vitis]